MIYFCCGDYSCDFTLQIQQINKLIDCGTVCVVSTVEIRTYNEN